LLRKIFFYLFVALYVILCPLTILYALGYIFRPGGEQGLVTTGLIYLATAPPGATVYLDNKRYREKTPTILRDLLPGDYNIRLQLKRHKSWAQTVPVESKKANVLERVLLLPESLETETLVQAAFRDLIPMPGNSFFLLAAGPELGDYSVFDWKDEEHYPLVPPYSPFLEARVADVYSVPKSVLVIARVETEKGEKFLATEPRVKEGPVQDLTSLFIEPPSQVMWEPHHKRYLFTFQQGSIHRVDTGSRSVYPKFLENVKGYGLFDREIYALKRDHTLIKTDHEGKGGEIILQDRDFVETLFREKEFVRIIHLSRKLVVFLGPNGELWANRLPYTFVREGVLGFEFDPRMNRLLLRQKNALGFLDFSSDRPEEGLFEQGPELAWIYKKGVKIEQAFWVYEGSHILFRDEDKVFLVDLETYGKPRLDFLVKVKEKSSVFYAEEAGKLYFLEADTGNLTACEVLPRREILLPPFPEKPEEKQTREIQEL
jgi:hypothetical protein